MKWAVRKRQQEIGILFGIELAKKKKNLKPYMQTYSLPNSIWSTMSVTIIGQIAWKRLIDEFHPEGHINRKTGL